MAPASPSAARIRCKDKKHAGLWAERGPESGWVGKKAPVKGFEVFFLGDGEKSAEKLPWGGALLLWPPVPTSHYGQCLVRVVSVVAAFAGARAPPSSLSSSFAAADVDADATGRGVPAGTTIRASEARAAASTSRRTSTIEKRSWSLSRRLQARETP